MADRVDVLLRPIPDAGDVQRGDRGAGDREVHLGRLTRPDVDLPGIRPTDGAIRRETAEEEAVAAGGQTGKHPGVVHRDGESRAAIKRDRVAIRIQVRPGRGDREAHVTDTDDQGIAAGSR